MGDTLTAISPPGRKSSKAGGRPPGAGGHSPGRYFNSPEAEAVIAAIRREKDVVHY